MRTLTTLPLLCLFVLAFAIASHPFGARSQETPSPISDSDRESLERAIGRAAETARSGEPVPWRGVGDTGGTIIMGKAFSRASRAVCDSCEDPCRPVRYSIVTGTDLSHFQGTRCRQAGTSEGQWLAENTDTEVQHLASTTPPPIAAAQPISSQRKGLSDIPAPAPPEPHPDAVLIGEMQRLLAKLRYTSEDPNGEFSTATRRALAEFLVDERSTVPATTNADALDLLRVAEVRSARRRSCPATPEAEGKSFVGCGTLVRGR